MKINSTYPFQFIKNNQIDSIKMDDNISIISKATFNGCLNLKEVILPKNLIKIDEFAFSGCTNLTEIAIPEGTEEISTRAFADCKRLKKIILPNSIKKLGKAVFSGCENLEEVILPDTMQELPEELFLNCKKLKKVILPKNITSLPYAFFKGCKSLDIILSDIIDTLGDRCFDDCYKLEHFPLKVFKFGKYCFHNCRNLNNININVNTAKLPNGLFDGCLKLENIIYDGTTLSIGKRTFRNCISLKEIPSFISNLNERAFENCLSLTDLKVKAYVIPSACFRGCKNLVKLNIDGVNEIGTYAFSGCKSLKEINLENISDIGAEAFSNCHNLKDVKLGSITIIKPGTFKNCKALLNINLPDTIEKIDNEAFMNCYSIRKITIPANLKYLSSSAFSYMYSLEKIYVSKLNNTFQTPDNKILIESLKEKIVLYTIGSKDKAYSLNTYCQKFNNGIEHIQPIRSIGKYAFAGAKNLEELHIASCTTDIEYTAFENCPNLKKLFIKQVSFFPYIFLSIRNNGMYYMDVMKEKKDFPFEELYIEGDIQLIKDMSFVPINFKKVFLPQSSIYPIAHSAFSNSSKLDNIFIPNNVSKIQKDAFNPKTTLHFECGITTNNIEYMTQIESFGLSFKLIKTNDDKIYIAIKDKILYFTKEEMSKYITNIDNAWNHPEKIFAFLSKLIEHNISYKPFYNGRIIDIINYESALSLFENVKMNDKLLFYLFEKSELFTDLDNLSFQLLEKNNFQKIIDVRNLIEKYNIKDTFLMQKPFIVLDNENIYKYYDANLKRLLILSKTLENKINADVDLKDLSNLLTIVGGFSENNILRQKVYTFISEKMFMKTLPNGKLNPNYIVGNDIHRIFELSNSKISFNPEFATFFFENFDTLIQYEKEASGIIKRIYNNFESISKTSTSNKGRQRHIKVTFQKCLNFLSKTKFDNVPYEYLELANMIGCWYDNKEDFEHALSIYKESLLAPRNIFTKIEYDENYNPIYDNNPNNDLKEEIDNDFIYHWLPKQDYQNLILGKLCNCCAHVTGAGCGIMRASMILDNSQNLVIETKCGLIVAKATICLNRDGGYAVFNNVEVSLRIDYKDLEKIYNAFMRGTKAFMDTYNQNNPKCPIKNISIGAARNGLKSFLTDDKHPIIGIQNGINFGAYSIESGRSYNGDWQESQRLVLKK